MDDFKTETKSKFLGVRTSAIIEILFFFLFLFLIGFVIGKPFNYFDISPHPFWIIVILISAQYGTVEGLLAALISTAIYLLGGPIAERLILEPRSEYFLLISKMPILWFITAVILGELRLKHIREMNKLKDFVLHCQEKEQKVAESYNALKKFKERLEVRIAAEKQTPLMIINAVNHLEESSENTIEEIGLIIKNLVNPNKFSIFLFKSEELQLIKSWGWTDEDHYSTSFPPHSLLYANIIQNKIVCILASDFEILEKEGEIAVPIINQISNSVIGMIKIEDIPLFELRTTIVEILKETGQWVGKYILIK